MTSKASYFNFGLYKNTISRFKWGSFLYFIILFCSVPYAVFMRVYNGYSDITRYKNIILTDNFMIFPMLLAMAVPTIASVLIFNNMHSGKQCIALHALPITRKESFISQVLAGQTLMFVPVAANAVILLCMSAFSDEYRIVLGFLPILYWVVINCVIQFIMFSAAAFAGFITGNSAAHIVINILLHCIAPIIALSIFLISDIFLFGFVESSSFIANLLIENSPIVWVFSHGLELKEYDFFDFPQIWCYLILSIVLYGAAFVVYTKRKVETCGDVAAFKSLKPVFKYGITFAAAILLFNIFYYSEIPAVFLFLIVALLCAVIYFAGEMILNKTFKVFHKYKGFIGFSIFVAVVILGFAYTGVFGYETRVPEAENVKAAAIYDGYNGKLIANEDLIADVISSHKKILEDIVVIDGTRYHPEKNYSLKFSYELKNGKTLERRYYVTGEERELFLGMMYSYPQYKYAVTGLDNVYVDNVDVAQINVYFGGDSYGLQLGEHSNEFVKAVAKDIETLSFKEINHESPMYFNMRFSCTVAENKYKKYFKNMGIPYDDEEQYLHSVQSFHYEFNTDHKNVMALLEKLGYLDILEDYFSSNLYLYKEPVKLMEYGYEYADYKDELVTKYEREEIFLTDCIQLNEEDSKAVYSYIVDTNRMFAMEEGKEYYCIVQSNRNPEDVYVYNKVAGFTMDEMPEYLKKYLS